MITGNSAFRNCGSVEVWTP